MGVRVPFGVPIMKQGERKMEKTILAIDNRIALLRSRNKDNGPIITKLLRKRRRLAEKAE